MKFRMSARDWDSNLQKRFGDRSSIVELTADEVVQAIIQFGRAEISEEINPLGKEELFGVFNFEFQNTYD